MIAGFLATVVLAVGTDFLLIQIFGSRTETSSPGLLAATLIYTELYVAAGGFVTGRIARGMNPVFVLAGIAFVITAANLFLVTNSVPIWYKAVSLLCLAPFTLAGGWLATRERRRIT